MPGAEFAGASGADADMSAKISGTGNRLFTGTWDVTDGTKLHASGTENTGTATVNTHTTGILSLDAFDGNLDSRVTGAGTVALTDSADVTITDTGSPFTRGNTRVDVNNVGGTGAQTVNGIELVHVDGNSAGDFALENGTVEAGAYVYTLAKGTGEAAKNWYLTSKWNGAVCERAQQHPEQPRRVWF